MFGTTKPLHDQLSSVGSTTDFSSQENFYESANFTFDGVDSVGSGTDFSNQEESTFENVLNTGEFILPDDSMNLADSTILDVVVYQDDSANLDDSIIIAWGVDADDSSNLADETEVGWTYTAEDSYGLDDSVEILGPVIANDSLNLDDSTVAELLFDVQDSANLDDSTGITASLESDDSLNLDDSVLFNLDLGIDDSMALSDTASVGMGIESEESLNLADEISVRRTVNLSFSTSISIIQQKSLSFSTQISALHFDPPAVSILSSPTNQLNPSTSIGGSTFISNVSTAKSGDHISIDFASAFGSCGIQSFNIDSSIGNIGSFSIYADSKFLDANETFELCGLRAHVKEIGPFSGSDKGKGYLISGTLGPAAKLNEKLYLTARNTTMLNNLAAQFPLTQPPSTEWGTVESAARAIAANAGVSLIWTTFDAPLPDAFVETDMRVGEALSSLASRVGGVLVWDGKDSVVVTTPYPGYGVWEGIPDCSLWGRGGMTGPILVVDTDNESAVLPVDLASQTLISSGAGSLKAAAVPKVETIHVFDSKMKTDAPPLYLRLAGDFKSPAKVQILVNNIDDVGLSPYATMDKDQWFDAPYSTVKLSDKKKALIINPSDIPSGMRNGSFHMTIGYVRDTSGIENFHADAIEVYGQKKSTILTGIYEKIRYFRWQYATASFPLFGSLPLPGNKATLTYDGNTIVGTVESVNVNGGRNQPPEVKLTIGSYVRLTFDRPISTVTGLSIQSGAPY